MAFAALWCKSHYSFLEGASGPDELVHRAKQAGLAAIAITDRDGVYGIVRAHTAAREAGVRLIVGAQITVGGGLTVVLLTRNAEGYRNLCGLITTGRRRCPKGESLVTLDELCAAAGGLVAVVPAGTERPVMKGKGGKDGKCRDSGECPDGFWPAMKRAWGEWLFIGLARHHLPGDARDTATARHIAATEGIRIAALPEVLYHDADRRPLQDVLTCIRHRTTLEEAGGLLRANHHYDLKSATDYSALYADLPDSFENSLLIADSCRFTLDEIHYRYPTEELPQGYTVMEWLTALVKEGAGRRYPEGIPADVERQIGRELEIIDHLEYGGYFLTMREIVRFCSEQGILCQGRGSAANSIVCYCLGITAVDPVLMDLLFERFLSLERAEPPDIDLDIDHRRREEVIQHMYRKYGRDRAAMVANFIRYRSKSAVRDVGRALGFSSVALERLARNLGPWWENPDENLERHLSAEPETGKAAEALEAGGSSAAMAGTADRKSLLRRLCREIQDFPRHLSIHPGGFILGSHPVAHLVPVENATMPDRTVIQWDKYDVEAMNLFKVDLLGLGALSHLDQTMKLLHRHAGIDVSLADVSGMGDDPEVFQALCRADTVGVFQVESRAQMAMLPRLKPQRFYDLVIEVSIVRPGPISGGMVHPYLRRRSGEETVVYPHPSLEPVLKKTLGVPLFQEQVMKLAVVGADYSPGEADQLRRDMGAWRSSSRLAQHREKLITRMVNKGIKPEFAEAVYNQIQGFGEYGFPESHAASFALIAYATAWFKVKYPAFFTCGLLNAWPMGFYSPATVVDDARRHGIQVLPVDVRRSAWNCVPERADPAGCWGVRMGLRYVKGLSRADGQAVESLGGELIASVDEFARRSGLGVGAMKALTLAGAFESLDGNRRSQLWHSLLGHTREGDQAAEQERHWGDFEADPIPFENLNPFESIDWDYSASMHSVRGHPVETVREELNLLGFPDSEEVRGRPDGSYISYAGLVICRQRPGTAAGVLFITLEDECGFVNLVVWQKVYEKYREFLLTRSLLGVRGRVQAGDGVVHLIVQECFDPPVSPASAEKASRDFR